MISTPLVAVMRLIVPVTMVVGVAVLIKGYSDTGDGFAAGVIVALGVLFVYVAGGAKYAEETLPVSRAPQIAVAGLTLALGVAFIPVFFGNPILTHYPGPGQEVVHIGTLELMSAFAFDVGVFWLVVGAITTMTRLVARGRSTAR